MTSATLRALIAERRQQCGPVPYRPPTGSPPRIELSPESIAAARRAIAAGKVFEFVTGKPNFRNDDDEALPVPDLAGPGCALFMWIHGAMLEQAIAVGAAWRFKLINPASVWTKVTQSGKPHMGNGYIRDRQNTNPTT
jgi:hypothetical protein